MVKARTAKNAEVTHEDETKPHSAANQPRVVEAEAKQEGITQQDDTSNKGDTVNETNAVSEASVTDETDEANATEKTTLTLSPENKKFLQFRKIDGKGSMTKQVNRLIEQARTVERGETAPATPGHDTPPA